MTTIDFSHLNTEQRLELISELWDSLDHNAVPMTADQAAEIERRLDELEKEPDQGRDAYEVLEEMRINL